MLFDWFIFIPLVIAFALVASITLICGRAGGPWRVLGVLVSLGLGGFCFLVGYFIGIEGFSLTRHDNITYPVGGWIGMIGGCLISILGIWLSLKKVKVCFSCFPSFINFRGVVNKYFFHNFKNE